MYKNIEGEIKINKNLYEKVVLILKGRDYKNGAHLNIEYNKSEFKSFFKSNFNDIEYIELNTRYMIFNDDISKNKDFIVDLIKDREVRSISLLNLFEHDKNYLLLLKTISELFLDGIFKNQKLIVSANNISNRNHLFKILQNEFDSNGELFFSSKNLDNIMANNKFVMLKEENLFVSHIDNLNQDYMGKTDDLNNSALINEKESLSLKNTYACKYLDYLEDTMNVYSYVNKFLRVYEFNNMLDNKIIDKKNTPLLKKKNFISVIIRTQGKRLESFSEVLLCLSAQKNIYFDVLVICHNVSQENLNSISMIVDNLPDWLRANIRLIKINSGNRTSILNEALKEVKTDYFSILDDDDIVFDNWIKCFYDLYKISPGYVFHAYVATQDWDVNKKNKFFMRSCSRLKPDYCRDFNIIDQIKSNFCPVMSLAFPICVFKNFFIKFDEDLTTTEDYDFLMRCVSICGIKNIKQVVAIYRRWRNYENSYTCETRNKWIENQNKINEKMKLMPFVLFKSDLEPVNLAKTNIISKLISKIKKLKDSTSPLRDIINFLKRRI